MTLATPVANLRYPSEEGGVYRVGIEETTDKARVYWEEVDEDSGEIYWQCFATFDATDEDGFRMSKEQLIDQAQDIIVAHKLESGDATPTTRHFS